MLIELIRLSTSEESTIGALSINGRFRCYTIEDTWRMQKKAGETRIPEGLYDVQLRTEGGMHGRYGERYDFHRGMLWLQDVPDFEWIYIHTGNKAAHSEGCILVGDSANNNQLAEGFVGHSTQAYKRIYPAIAEAILAGERVEMQIRAFG